MKSYLGILILSLSFAAQANARISCRVILSRIMAVGARPTRVKTTTDQIRLLEKIYAEGYVDPSELSGAEKVTVTQLIELRFVIEKVIDYGEYIVGARYQLSLKGFRAMVAREKQLDQTKQNEVF